MKKIQVEFIINGKNARIEVEPNHTLLDVLRDELKLTGAKDACGGEGECGACSVFFDHKLVNACMVFIGQVDGHSITTIEGIADPGKLHPLQKSFIEAGAVQCGYCTPGAILTAKALLDKNPNPSDAEIRESLSGNLCRCTGYSKMVEAVHLAARELSHG
jgi:aerobic-type carbon monoxide dehydrogenase small subunit (CoxS/CutS family)